MESRLLLASWLLFLAVPARALDVLLFEDFETVGETIASDWDIVAAAGVTFDTRSGSRTLRITPQSSALTAVPVRGARRVRAAATFMAAGLSDDGACLAEASADGGLTWFTVLRVIGGQDDGVTRHAGSVWREVPDASDTVRFRAWLSGGTDSAACWLDHVAVLGERPQAGPHAASRRVLTQNELLSPQPLAAPVRMGEFAQPAGAKGPGAVFRGSLRFAGGSPAEGFEVVHDARERVAGVGAPIRQLPPFEIGIVQRGDDLVPLQGSLKRTAHPYWEIVFLPGKAWQEQDDGDWTRVALPFALQERAANCIHNGAMTWLFDAEGRISKLAYAIASETCGYFKFDMWGTALVDYTQQDDFAEAAAALARFDRHRASRLPVRPLAVLREAYPELDPFGLATDDGIDPGEITVLGIVVDGVHYRSECRTRRGPHPYCASLPLPSNSTASSIFAGIAVMRLERLYPGVSQEAVGALIDRCNPRRWRDVTIENVLDMATGNFRSHDFEEDEFSVPHQWFLFADTHRDKLSFACNFFPRKAKPGTRFVHHTSDSYVLGAALAEVLGRHDTGADLYDSMIAQPIWRPLELSPLLDSSRRTYDEIGQPYTGYGLTFEADDVVRIAAWLHDGAALAGTSMLDRALLDAALQRDPADRGLVTGKTGLVYNNGFWGFDAGPSLGCNAAVWVPFMAGTGGITVAIFPTGVIYYYFSDSDVFRWQSAREAAHRIEPLC